MLTPLPLLSRVGSAGRLAILNSIILALVLGAVVAVFIRNFTSSYQAVAASSIGTELREFEQQALKQKPANLEAFAASFLRSHALAPGEVVVIDLTKNSRLVTPGSGPVLASPLVRTWVLNPPSRSVVVSTVIGGHPTELVGAPIIAGHTVVGTFIATSDLNAFAKERSREILLSIAEGTIALLAGIISTFVLLRRLLRKVGRITTTADEIGSGTLDQRLGDQGSNDEVGELARTFDAMLDRVQAAMTAQRRLLSDVSHQLRTPLTVVRGHLEVLGRGGADDPLEVRETLNLVIDEIDHTQVVVERLLMLGRAMEPDFLDIRPVEVHVLLDEVYEAVRVLADRQFLLPQAPQDLVAVVDAEKIRGALMNLIDNAVHATVPGDAIALVAEVDYLDDVIRLSVDDSGPGIPEDQRAAVLQRFSRPGARDRDGSGLGLAIVKAVAEGHGGRITIATSDLEGARVTIVLPRARTRATEDS
ncbi:MAG TPA: HAMP domain-containing sensor histidine kinase [Acidimicrobiales bacterium]|nr:HAMP domain-containing sensor histidine kinase [Acidimicrobiales bacterium]